jgi:glycosyltransferase involved in cell wall biosynthesis
MTSPPHPALSGDDRDIRRVIVLTAIYPPDIRVGGQRPAKLVRYLREAGVEVDVVTDATTGAVSGIGPAGERIHPVAASRTVRDVVATALKRRKGGAPVSGGTSTSPVGGVQHPSRLRREVRSLLVAPDLSRGLIGPMARKVSELLAEGPAVVYSTAPPFSVHLAAWRAKRGQRAPWVAGFRDPWFSGPTGEHGTRTLGIAIVDRILRRAFRSIDLCVAASEGIADWWRETGTDAPAVVARNGIDSLTDAVPARRSDAPGPDLLYLGELYGGRDPRPFFAGLRQFCDHNDPTCASLQAWFVGEVAHFGALSTQQLIDDAGVHAWVGLRKPVPHADALELLKRSRVLLLLAQGQPRQVPNKLYEYLGTRKPILAFVDDTGESADLLRRAGGHFLVTEHTASEAIPETIAAALRAAGRDELVGDQAFLATLSSDAQIRLVVDAIAGIGTGALGWKR